MEILGIGNDIIAISRIAASIEKHGQRFIDKVFTVKEREYCEGYGGDRIGHYAGRFAAKEAAVKALGTGFSQGISWHDIEILNDSNGKPYVVVSDIIIEKFGGIDIMISLSHCHSSATAVALAFINDQ